MQLRLGSTRQLFGDKHHVGQGSRRKISVNTSLNDEIDKQTSMKVKYENQSDKGVTILTRTPLQKRKERSAANLHLSRIYFGSDSSCASRVVIHPQSSFTKRWDIYVALLLVYTAYVTPYEVAFLTTKFNFLFVLNQVVNLSFVFDMGKTFFTAYFDKDKMVLRGDLSAISCHYLRSWFLVDLVSILPFDSVGLLTESETLKKAKGARVIRLLRLLKLLRLVRSMRILNRYQDTFGLTNAFKSGMRFLVMMITSMHWFACALRLIPDLYEVRNPIFVDATPGAEDEMETWSWLTQTTSAGRLLVHCSGSNANKNAHARATVDVDCVRTHAVGCALEECGWVKWQYCVLCFDTQDG